MYINASMINHEDIFEFLNQNRIIELYAIDLSKALHIDSLYGTLRKLNVLGNQCYQL